MSLEHGPQDEFAQLSDREVVELYVKLYEKANPGAITTDEGREGIIQGHLDAFHDKRTDPVTGSTMQRQDTNPHNRAGLIAAIRSIQSELANRENQS